MISEPSHKTNTHLTTKCDQPKTSMNTSLPNEATRFTSNKRPLFPTTAQNNGKLPRLLPR
ncbi:hypothetical protein CRN62_02350 [Vibrio vulnificus]|nr:hypothetical protein CRN62_02350 [Vibrio vulnificus]POB82110.1 hypothetical protein CRN35_04580 [Vibrio vulnificus]POB89402.1 hypothetical protein CRN30_00315 [Vibrio vulnificus]POB96314.1 hypothetical protein CRN53_06530 [Vibrio vulnificus]POC38065.1 hypothetical protein CRN50_05890 [Vibrio vulnificus]